MTFWYVVIGPLKIFAMSLFHVGTILRFPIYKTIFKVESISSNSAFFNITSMYRNNSLNYLSKTCFLMDLFTFNSFYIFSIKFSLLVIMFIFLQIHSKPNFCGNSINKAKESYLEIVPMFDQDPKSIHRLRKLNRPQTHTNPWLTERLPRPLRLPRRRPSKVKLILKIHG